MLFSTAAIPIYIPTKTVYKDSLFSTSSPVFVICVLFDDSALTPVRWYINVFLTFISLILSIFSCAFWSSAYPLWEKCLLRSAHFLNGLCGFLILIYMNCLYILDINSLSVIPFANIFSLSVSYLFLFAVQTLLSLIRAHLFIFAFISFALEDWSQKNIAAIYVKKYLPAFSSGSFMVSSLEFRSLIHFEFIFVYGVRECSYFILLHVAVHNFSSITY